MSNLRSNSTRPNATPAETPPPVNSMEELVQILTLQERGRQTEKAQQKQEREDRAERRQRDTEETERKRIVDKAEALEREQRDREERAIQRQEDREIREHKERVEERRRLEEKEIREDMLRQEKERRQEREERESQRREERESQRREEREQAREAQRTMTATLQSQQAGQERTLEAARTKRVRIGVDIPVLPKLGDPRQMEVFLEQFKRDMVVPPRQWTTTLRPLLDGKSVDYSRHLPQTIQEDFELLSKELTRLHGISPEFHGCAWRDLVQGTEEDLLQWNVRIGFAIRAWMKDCGDREAILDRLQMERFISSMNQDTERWVRNQSPKTSEEAAQIANTYQRNAKGTINNLTGWGARIQPNLRPHPLPNYPNTRPSNQPPNRNNSSTSPRNFGDRRSGERKPGGRLPEWDPVLGPRCFNCNLYGHIANDCSAKPRVKVEKPTMKTEVALMAVWTDFSSPEPGSSLGEQQIEGTINGIPAPNMKRDSGTSLSFVDQRFLEPNYPRGTPARVTTVQGTALYPTTNVKININGHDLTLRMAVSHDFVFDALLGTDIPNLDRLARYPGRQQPRRACRVRDSPIREEESTDEERWNLVQHHRQKCPQRCRPLSANRSQRTPIQKLSNSERESSEAGSRDETTPGRPYKRTRGDPPRGRRNTVLPQVRRSGEQPPRTDSNNEDASSEIESQADSDTCSREGLPIDRELGGPPRANPSEHRESGDQPPRPDSNSEGTTPGRPYKRTRGDPPEEEEIPSCPKCGDRENNHPERTRTETKQETLQEEEEMPSCPKCGDRENTHPKRMRTETKPDLTNLLQPMTPRMTT